MSNEELNKKMEFIVEHQAKFAADIEIMREVQAKTETQLHNLSRAVITVVGLVGELTEAQLRSDERLNSLINIVERHISGNGGPANPS